MDIKAIVVDLDGTLLSSKKEVSERSIQALLAAHGKGIRIIVATARPPRSVKLLLPEEIRRISSFIYYNGAMIACPYTNLSNHQALEQELSASLLDYILQDDKVDVSIEVADQWYAPREFDIDVIHAVGGMPIVLPLEQLKLLQPTKIIAAKMANYESLMNRFGDKVRILVTDRGELIQISHLQVGKELALQQLCQEYKLPLSDVIVFGDDTNDIGLFQTSCYSVAMGNAVEELKQLADEVTSSNDEDGVALVLERLIAN